jgi:hypothetical protein
LFIKKTSFEEKSPLNFFIYHFVREMQELYLIVQRANEKFYREETGAREKSLPTPRSISVSGREWTEP